MVNTKAWTVIIMVIVVVAAVGVTVYHAHQASILSTPFLCRDPSNISSHIYNPARLQTVRDCVTASGIVDNVITEDDGDYHVWFRVDSQYANLPNGVNNDYGQGDLLAEIICATNVYQQDAVLACQNYTNHIPLPTINQNITVTGPYVLDSTHGWMEIHPVYSLLVS